MGLKEKAAVVSLTGILCVLFYMATSINFYTLQLDSAHMVELIDTTYKYHFPRTGLEKSVIFAITSMLSEPAAKICASSLAPESPELLNVLERHTYLVLYLMAPFHLLFESKSIVFFANTIAFVGFLLVVYLALRYSGVPIAHSLVFTAFVSAHPVWSISAFGQLYPDKYFPLPGLIYLCLLYRYLAGWEPRRTGVILLAGILAASITERAALTLGGLTIAMLVIYRGVAKWRREDLPVLGFGAGALAFALVYLKFFQHHSYYDSFRASTAYFFTDILHKPGYARRIEEFLLINILLFGILSAFEWRLGAIALAAMLPNIVGTLGGQEKTTWSTHYHSIYFPFLVAGALFGFVNLWKALQNSRWRHFILAAPILLGSCLALLDPEWNDRFFDFSTSHLSDYALVKAVEFQTDSGRAASVIYFSKLRRDVADSVPQGSEVTTTEGFMPALYGDRIIHFYPLGLMTSDYAVLPYKKDTQGTKLFTGAVSYLGPEQQDELDRCLNGRLKSAGYSMVRDFPIVGGVDGMAVLKRDQPPPAANEHSRN